MSKFLKKFFKGQDRFTKKSVYAAVVTLVLVLIAINVSPELKIFVAGLTVLEQVAYLGLLEALSVVIADKYFVK